jgi:hypothetical protein
LERTVPDGDDVEVDLGSLLPEAGVAGFLRASLAFRGSRALVRASQFVWPGLRGLVDGTLLDADRLPSNLRLDESSHVLQASGGGLSLDLEAAYRQARVAFRDSTERIVTFDIMRPGVTLALATDTGAERFVPIGGMLPVSSDSADYLVIRCSDTAAGLDVRGTLDPECFARSGLRRFALSALTGAASHDEIRLTHATRREAEQVVLRIAPTTAPKSFRVDRIGSDGDLRVQIAMAQTCGAVRLVATDLMTSDVIEADVALGRWPVEHPSAGLVAAELAITPNPALTVRVKPQRLGQGAYIGELLVRAEGTDRWMPFVTGRGDRFIFGLGTPVANWPHESAPALFARLTDALNMTIAAET